MSAGWNWSHHYPPPCPPLPPDASQLIQRITEAEQNVRQLADRLSQVERQLAEVQARKPLHVEYHFDQLKVNELKGTLNVGLSPSGVQGIDSFETPPGSWPQQAENNAAAGADQQALADLMRQMDSYMETEASAYLAGLEQQFGAALDTDHRSRLLNDVKKQLKERVRYYANTSAYPADGTEDERQTWHRLILDKTARDVREALTTYMRKWKMGTSNDAEGEDAS